MDKLVNNVIFQAPMCNISLKKEGFVISSLHSAGHITSPTYHVFDKLSVVLLPEATVTWIHKIISGI